VTHAPAEPLAPESAQAEVDDVHARIEAVLYDSLEEQWDEVLSQWDGAEASDRADVRATVAAVRDEIFEGLRPVESNDELQRGLAVAYLETKCRWTLLNTRIQYQTAQNGPPQDALLYRATCVSLIVQALEPLLEPEAVQSVAGMFADPVSG